MSELRFQLPRSLPESEYYRRGMSLLRRITSEIVLNPEGLNPDPYLEGLRRGVPQYQRILWEKEVM